MSAAEEPIGVLIVDDEGPARTGLREILARAPGVTVLAECENGFDAVRAAAEWKPDAVFLDIEMPKLNGFEVLELLDPAIAVVFVTAYDEYAVRAFEVAAVDYVLKPYREERLREALARARDRAARRERVDPARLSAAARPPGRHLERLAVRDGGRIHIIPVLKLDFAEARDDAVAIRSEGRTFVKAQTLSSLADSLDPRRFLRVHRSFVVNVDRLRQIEAYSKNSHVVILADGSRIPISREGHAKLRALLGGGPLTA